SAPAPAEPEIYEKGAAGIVTAVLVHKVEPFYPIFERRNEIEGKVGVKFVVRADGTVAEVSVIKSSGSNNFDESAVKAVKQWKFKPAMKGDKPVKMLIKQYVVFRLEE
ncbi:MAG: energy transducer TonB, partial [Nitrospirota bacterium]|nr:energy transducer TonB [Nitrospirota bacterium]